MVNFTTVACRISARLKWYKNYKNRLRLAKVIVKNTMTRFYGSLCISETNQQEGWCGVAREAVGVVSAAICWRSPSSRVAAQQQQQQQLVGCWRCSKTPEITRRSSRCCELRRFLKRVERCTANRLMTTKQPLFLTASRRRRKKLRRQVCRGVHDVKCRGSWDAMIFNH